MSQMSAAMTRTVAAMAISWRRLCILFACANLRSLMGYRTSCEEAGNLGKR